MDGSGSLFGSRCLLYILCSNFKDKSNIQLSGDSVCSEHLRYFSPAALGDIIGNPEDYMSYKVWSQDEEGFYEANVSSAVYTEPDQQEVVGLPEGAMLVTLTIENEFYSTMAIEDLDIYVGESTSESPPL